MCGLKKASRAWYEDLSSFLVNNGFENGKVNITLFHKNYDSQIILVQIYMDDIIFGATNEPLWEFFKANVGWIQNKYDGRAEVLLGTIDKTNQQWNLYPSNQVC